MFERQKDNVADVSRSRSVKASAVHFVCRNDLQKDASEAVMRGRRSSLGIVVSHGALHDSTPCCPILYDNSALSEKRYSIFAWDVSVPFDLYYGP